MNVVLSTKPSDAEDPRYRLTRSPECPNDAPAQAALGKEAGTCGFCAWGFYTMASAGHQQGEDLQELDLERVNDGEARAGYKAQCGMVKLYRDNQGRIGAVREIDGQERFFPGLKGNWAFERYLTRHPNMGASHART